MLVLHLVQSTFERGMWIFAPFCGAEFLRLFLFFINPPFFSGTKFYLFYYLQIDFLKQRLTFVSARAFELSSGTRPMLGQGERLKFLKVIKERRV